MIVIVCSCALPSMQRFESALEGWRSQQESLSALTRSVLEMRPRSMSLSEIKDKQESVKVDIKSHLGGAKQGHARIRLLLSDLQLIPCRYQICTATKHFRAICNILEKSMNLLDEEIDAVETVWSGKSEEMNDTLTSLKYLRSLEKVLYWWRSHGSLFVVRSV